MKIVDAEYTNDRLVEYKKYIGIYWNGKADERIIEYSGYLLTNTKATTPPEQKYFTKKEDAEKGLIELKKVMKKYNGYIMPVWFFYSNVLGALSHRQRDSK